MAVDIFIKLEGIEGEAQDKEHKKEIDVLSWSWGMSQNGTMHLGAGGGSGKVSVQDLSITKYVDSASPAIMTYCCNGKQFATAKLTIRKAGGSAPVEYVILELKEVIVTSVSTGGSGGEDRLTENVSLNFAKFSYAYTPQDQKGAAGTKIPMTWDIAQNVA